MQEDGKRFPEVSLLRSRQPYNTTLNLQSKSLFVLTSFAYCDDYKWLILGLLHLVMPPQPYQCILVRVDAPLELRVLGGMQDLLEFWPRTEPHVYQVVARQQPNRANLVGRGLSQ